MRFLVDECAGPAVASWLRGEGHDVFSVFDEARGSDDATIIRNAWTEDRIIITADKDFGTMVFRERHPHHGVVLLRLVDERAPAKIAALKGLLGTHADRVRDQFVVVTDTQVRFATIRKPPSKPR